ncbi:MAG: glycosyltransferase [Balneolaceae bacterium]|nr:glycosyltransferase [Balneolaceae bacterium]
MQSITDLLQLINYLVLGYFILLNLGYMILIGVSYFHIRKFKDLDKIFKMTGVYSTSLYKPVSVIAPAYNEEASIIASVDSLLSLKYSNFEVVVVNDGSSDGTLQKLLDHYKLTPENRHKPLFVKHKPIRGIYTSSRYPRLIVVDKENGGKADALNAGINIASMDLFCAVDSDSILEPDVIVKMLRTFMEDDQTIAVGGVIRVANGCTYKNRRIEKVRVPKSFIGRIQAVEYLRAFLFGRVGWDYLESLLIISGAFGLFERKAVIRAGGYLHDTVGEDMELVVRLHDYHIKNKLPYRIRFISEPVCWTEVPEDRKTLARQRNRWHRGLADTLFRYRHMLFNPRYGRIGLFAMPFFFFGELLSPVVEISGYIIVALSWWFGIINTQFAMLFLVAAIVLGMILSMSAVLLEELTSRRYESAKDIFILACYSFVENLGYRQLHAFWRLGGLIDYFKGEKEWGKMQRKGIGEKSS